ncbi:MAG: hypothetical protein AAF567_11545 [Actinomycetota bacterium]
MTDQALGGDAAMRAFGAKQAEPTFDEPAFTVLGKPLAGATVAIVTSAALHRPDKDRYAPGDTGFRADYTKAALELATGPTPGSRAAEAWFWEETEADKTMQAPRRALKEQEAPHPFWFYIAPAHR